MFGNPLILQSGTELIRNPEGLKQSIKLFSHRSGDRNADCVEEVTEKNQTKEDRYQFTVTHPAQPSLTRPFL